MAEKPTYLYYAAEYNGALGNAEFSASLCNGGRAVRNIIGFNTPETPKQLDAYQRAVCAAVDVDAAYGASGGIGEGAKSVSIGSFSASSTNSGATTAYDLDMSQAIRRELIGSGLLFQGIA